MRQLLLVLLVACTCSSLFAQLNTTLRDNLDYSANVNDVWGYVAPDGTEYAIVGLETGVSFVSLANPDDIVEVAFIEGDFSAWRDMKTFGEYAYSVADQRTSTEGITAFNLTELPDRVTFERNTYVIPGTGGLTFQRSHNVYMDTTNGILYTAGGTQNIRDGGVLMFDVKDNPMNPELVGLGPALYAHDVFVLEDTMYTSEIFNGTLGVYDVSDFDNITQLGQVATPFNFTHNAWTSTDGRYIFTTDERANAPVASYDLSDKNDIRLLDEYRPFESLGNGTIPHNAHVIDDYLSISYYTDGLRVVDASVPDNLVEVANYDTWLGPDGDFNGNWGAYPYLPSGLTLVSDRQTGLYVVDVDYKRAARVRGTATDLAEGFGIPGVNVFIAAAPSALEVTDNQGGYATGVADGGLYNVEFSAEGYYDLVTQVELTNGATADLNVQLRRGTPQTVNITVVDAFTGEPIEQAVAEFNGRFNNLELTADADGVITQADVLDSESFTVYIAKWGYQAVELTDISSADLTDLQVELTPGYRDDFATDLGWEVTGLAPRGIWERAEPRGTFGAGVQIAPENDVADDLGDAAYVTGNAPGSVGADDVDGGETVLTSPIFGRLPIEFVDADVTDLIIQYQYQFANFATNQSPASDDMQVYLSNGTDSVLVRTYTGLINEWTRDSFNVTGFLDLTDNMRLTVIATDRDGANLVEGAIDNFSVTEVLTVSSQEVFAPNTAVSVFPNPTADAFTLRYETTVTDHLTLRVTDATGRLVRERSLVGGNGTARVGSDLPAGLYFLQLNGAGGRLWVGKALKR